MRVVGGRRTKLKWPNDVHIDGLKVCGILAELLPTGDAVVHRRRPQPLPHRRRTAGADRYLASDRRRASGG